MSILFFVWSVRIPNQVAEYDEVIVFKCHQMAYVRCKEITLYVKWYVEMFDLKLNALNDK